MSDPMAPWATMYSADLQADANKYAADEASDAASQNRALSLQEKQSNKATQAPWVDAGNTALNMLLVGQGLRTPEQASQSLLVKNESTFDSDAYLAAYPGLADTLRQWGWTPYQHYQTYGQQAGNPFTYKQGYGPEAAAQYASTYGSGTTSGGLPGYGGFNDKFTIEDFYANQDPAYGFRLQTGIDSITASGAAGGKMASGDMGVALQNYGQNLASEEWGNSYNRDLQQKTDQYNRLASMAGLGQTAATVLGSQGAQAVDSMNESNLTGATALGSGAIGSANAWASGFNNLANQGTAALGTWMKYYGGGSGGYGA